MLPSPNPSLFGGGTAALDGAPHKSATKEVIIKAVVTDDRFGSFASFFEYVRYVRPARLKQTLRSTRYHCIPGTKTAGALTH
jgi:hypothetical protein